MEETIKSINTIFKLVIKNPKYSWIVGSDICLQKEDILQEIFCRFLEERNKAYITSNRALLTVFIINMVKKTRQEYESQKRGYKTASGEVVRKESLSEMTDSDEYLTSFVDESETLRKDVRDMLYFLRDDTEGDDINLLIDYYAVGLTYDEMAEAYGYSSRGSVKKKIDKVLFNLLDTIRECFQDIRELRKMQ